MLGSGGILTFHQGGEQRDVGRFPPARRQVEAQPVQLLPQTAAAVLRLRSVRGKMKGNFGGHYISNFHMANG